MPPRPLLLHRNPLSGHSPSTFFAYFSPWHMSPPNLLHNLYILCLLYTNRCLPVLFRVQDLIFLSREDRDHGFPFQTPPGGQDSPGGEAKTPLSSQVATRISWSPLSGLKGVEPPLQFGERTRDYSPGQAGKEGPHLAMTGASQGFPRAAAPVGVFSRGTTRISGSLSCGARELMSPCAWRGELVITLESWEVTRASRRVEEGLSRSFSGGGGKPSFPSTSAGDYRELPRCL